MRRLASITVLCLVGATSSFSQATPADQPPSWAKDMVWYQIFVERFHNGDRSNDPTSESISIPALGQNAPAGWSVTAWNKDWYEQEPWAVKAGLPFQRGLQFRRYGGDLKGVIDKLDYLQALGVTAIFLNPINHAPSLHKYDASSFHHVDANFGPDPKGDLKIMASENPEDPSTWKWTAADKLFLKLVQEVHKRKMKVIMDFSWNHTGTRFWAWEDILKNQKNSKYSGWYEIKTFDNPATTQSEFAYAGWAGVSSLPELKKVNVNPPRRSGNPFEGNTEPSVAKHVFDVSKRWLAPDGDASRGIDGFRLDVADQVPLGFWRDYRKLVRGIKSDAYLVGEIWWQLFPEKFMNPVPYVKGDIFDAVTFYHLYRPSRYFFAKTNFDIDAKAFRDSVNYELKRLTPATQKAMMVVSASHDAPRVLTDFYNPNKYKFKSSPGDDPAFKTGKPDKESYQRVRMYLVSMFTGVGAPHIWNGEELGMWGADDPHCRKPMWWQDIKFDPETRNNFQPGPKETDPVGFNNEHFQWYQKLIQLRVGQGALVNGKLEYLVAEGKKLAYARDDGKDEIIVVFNMETTRQAIALPRRGNYIDLLSNKTFDPGKVYLDPLSAMVLKRL